MKTLFRSLVFAFSCMGVCAVAIADSANDDAVFFKAMSAREAGNYEESIRLFESILSNNPSLSRARAELAVAYFRAMNFAEAKRHIDAVLADKATPGSVRDKMVQFLALIEKEGRPSLFIPSVSVGFGYDSNVNAGIRSSVVQAGGFSLHIDPSAKPREAAYVSASAGVAHRYLFDGKVGFGGDQLTVLWQSQANYFAQSYQGAGNDVFDLGVLTVSTGPALVSPGKWRASVAVQHDYVTMGHDYLAAYTGLNPAITFIVRGATELTLDGVVQQRRYADQYAGRDSVYRNTGVSVSRKYGDGKYTAVAGVKVFDENADESRFTNRGSEIFVGGGYRPLANLTVFGRISDKHTRFDGVEPIFGEARNEHEYRQVVGISYKIESGVLRDWSIAGTLSATQNRSNIEIYTYDRTQAGVSLSAQF